MSGIVIDAKTALWRPHLDGEHLRRIRDAGVHGVSITMIGVARRRGELFDYEAALEGTLLFRSCIERQSNVALLVLEPDDFERAKREGKVGVMLDLQQAAFLADDLARIDAMWLAGIRQVQLTYNGQTRIGAGCGEARPRKSATAGLSRVGRQVVQRLNELGVIVDCAHVGTATTLDAIEASAAPILFSHTGARAVHDSPRSKTDEEIRALAARGGVICIYAVPFFIRDSAGTLDDVVSHIDHCVQLVGPKHVGIGTDRALCAHEDSLAKQDYLDMLEPVMSVEFPEDLFPGVGDKLWPPDAAGLRSTEEMVVLRERLGALGYSAAAIDSILGDNVLRVYREVHAMRSQESTDEALAKVWDHSYNLANIRP